METPDPPNSRWLHRRRVRDIGSFALIGAVVAVGILLAALAAFMLHERHVDDHNREFSSSADALAERTRIRTTATLARVNDISNLIAVAGVPTRAGFQHYLKEAALKDQPWLRQVAFVERIPRTRLADIAERELIQSGEPFRPSLIDPKATEYAVITRTNAAVGDQIGIDIASVPGIPERLRQTAENGNAVYAPIETSVAGVVILLTTPPGLVNGDGSSLGGVVPVFRDPSEKPLGWLLVEIDTEGMLGTDDQSSSAVRLSPQDHAESAVEIPAPQATGGASTNRLERSFLAHGVNWQVEIVSGAAAGVGLPAVAALIGGVLVSLILGLLLAAQRRAVYANDRLAESERERRLDDLTGLPNRVGITEALITALKERDTGGQPAAVLFCDVDRFKVINDSLGHQVGDELLGIIARRLRSSVRPADVVGRYGGDEFVVICPRLGGIEEARKIGERIADRIASPIRISGTEIEVSTSIGIAFAEPSVDRDGDELIRDADVAMYAAKNSRSVIRIFDESLRQGTLDRMAIEHALRAGLRSNGIHVAFQPIVNTRHHTIEALEALARFDDPVLATAGPERVVAVAEEIGVMDALGDRVLKEACDQLAAWNALRPDAAALELSVNVAEAQMRQTDFDVTVREALSRNSLDPHQLILELSETAALGEIEGSRDAFDKLTRLGVQLAIDDFGTGQSSLTQIAHMKSVAELKIDRSLVSSLSAPDVRVLLLSAISELAQGLGARLVAEGVETQEQLEVVSAAGVQRAQGFLFSGPLGAAEAEALVCNPDARLRPRLTTEREPRPAVPSAEA